MTDPTAVRRAPIMPLETEADHMARVAALVERARDWSPERRGAVLKYLQAQHTRVAARKKYRHPAEIAKATDRDYVHTPALQLISTALERCIREPGRNLLITMPPQEGKSTMVGVWGTIRALQLNPNTRVMLAAYSDDLAHTHSAAARDWIIGHGTNAVDPLTQTAVEDKLGLELTHPKASPSAWRIRGGRGGLVAVGIGASMTGKPADLMIIDDPYKNMQEADSAAFRQKIEMWLRSVAFTRLSPTASVILVQTRWHPEDLAGSIMKAEAAAADADKTWKYINIPAVSDPIRIPDALGRRESDEYMVSARGRTKAWFDAQRRKVGDRVWFAMYAGVPAPPSGGLFVRAWFERHRVLGELPRARLSLVAVDPAETGKGDEAGVLGGVLLDNGRIIATHDRSGKFTSDEWGRAAVDLALETGAVEIAVESYTAATTYVEVVKGAYRSRRREALNRRIAAETALPGDDVAVRNEAPPFRVHQWRGTGNAVARSGLLRQRTETGEFAVLGSELTTFEDQAVTWQEGQHQPDRVAAGAILLDRLNHLKGESASYADPTTVPASSVPSWMTRKLR